MAIKRLIALFLCAALCFLLTACGSVYVSVLEPEPSLNTIGPKPLTARERELLDLISINDQEIYLFSYQTDQDYRQIDFWVEIYKDGVLIEPNAGGISMLPDGMDLGEGMLAVTVSHTSDYRWKFALKQNGTIVSHTSEPNTNYMSGGRGAAQMFSPVEIEAEKEIVLYYTAFSNGPIGVYDGQKLIEQPELLQRYPYAHIIKCKFSNLPEEP